MGIESYHKRINLTRPTLVLLGIHMIKPWKCFEKPNLGLCVVYVTKKNEKRLFRADKVAKFCTRTLELIRDKLEDMLEQVQYKQLEMDIE